MENARPAPALKDLFTILYRPRETMRRILDSGRDRWAIQVVLLAFVCASVSDADFRHLGETLPGLTVVPVMAIVAMSIVFGAVCWLIALYLFSWIAALVGRMFGGAGIVRDVRAALAWAMVPWIWSVVYRIPVTVYKTRFPVGENPNVKEILVNFIADGGCTVIVVVVALQIVWVLWTLFIASSTLAEAQRVSTEKGFLNLVIALVLPLLVIGAAVFTFSK